MNQRPKTTGPTKSQLSLVFIAFSLAIAGFLLRDKWFGQQTKIAFSPSPGQNIFLVGDQIASGSDLDQSLRLGALLEKNLGKTVKSLALDNGLPISFDDQISRLGPLHPDLVILSLGAGAILAKEDLGQTLAKIRGAVKAIHQKSSMVVYLELNPPGMGDNWSMAISQLCHELKMLCIQDIYSGFWQHPDMTLEKIRPPGEANEKAALAIARTLQSHLKNR